MFKLSITFFLLALLSGILGFGGIASDLVGIAKIVFVVALIAFVISFFFEKGRAS